MDPSSPEMMRAQRAMLRQDYEKQRVASAGAGALGLDQAGPPNWSRPAWEAFKAQWGFYPFGNQDGTQVLPPTFEGAPDWVYELMNLRKPPITATMRPGA